MTERDFNRKNLEELLVDGLNRASGAHSAGELQRTLQKLGVNVERDHVKRTLDELVEQGRIAYTVSAFHRNGALRSGRAYHSLALLETLKSRGVEDPFERIAAGHRRPEPAHDGDTAPIDMDAVLSAQRKLSFESMES